MADEKLIRGIGRWDLTALVINSVIGAGIFGLPSKIYALLGTYSLVAFVVCAIVISVIVLCYAEVSSRFSSTGGPYLYTREAFSPFVAFEVGWLYWIVRLATFAANCNLFVTYLGFFILTASEPAVRVAIISLIVSILAVVNIIGVRHSVVMTDCFTVGKLLPLLVFVIVGLFFLNAANFSVNEVPQYSAFTNAVLLLIYAFVGFEVAVVPAAEAKDPQRDFPFALLVALAVVAVVYLLVQIVSIGTAPELATSERPLADAASHFMGPIGAAFVVTGALISILGNLNVGMLCGTRVAYAMGMQGDFPHVLSSTHSRFKTPHVATLVHSAIILVVTIQSSFLSALAIATITRLLIYATTCLSLVVFRHRNGVSEARFVAPYGTVTAIMSLALIVWLLTNVDMAGDGTRIVIVGIVGLAVYLSMKSYQRLTRS